MAVRETKEGRVIVDYRPDGRLQKRIRVKLPESVRTMEDLLSVEKLLKEASCADKKKGIPVPTFLTVDELFEKYLEWYEIHRSPKSPIDAAITGKHV